MENLIGNLNMPNTDGGSNSPSCGALLLSWILLIISVVLMTRYGDAGWFMSLLPVGIGMKIRNAHDRATMERLRETGNWHKLALIYFVLILVLVGVLVARGIRVDHISLPLLVIMMAFPTFVIMIIEDIKLCSGSRSDDS